MTVLLVLLVFISGAGSGAGVAVLLIGHAVRYALQHPDEVPQRMSVRLQRRLWLSDAQRAQIQKVLALHEPRLNQLREQVQPGVEGQLREIHQEISAVLNSNQRNRWDILFNDVMQNWMPPMTVAASTQP